MDHEFRDALIMAAVLAVVAVAGFLMGKGIAD